jgi:hypothetical protein
MSRTLRLPSQASATRITPSIAISRQAAQDERVIAALAAAKADARAAALADPRVQAFQAREAQAIFTGKQYDYFLAGQKSLAAEWKVKPDDAATVAAYEKELARLAVRWEEHPEEFVAGNPFERPEKTDYTYFRLVGSQATAAYKQGMSIESIEQEYNDVLDSVHTLESIIETIQADIA